MRFATRTRRCHADLQVSVDVSADRLRRGKTGGAVIQVLRTGVGKRQIGRMDRVSVLHAGGGGGGGRIWPDLSTRTRPALGSERWCQIDRRCLFTVMVLFLAASPQPTSVRAP
jgi:hypothetical protein